MKKDGFTLIELLAVVAIIGILAVLVVPNVIDYYKNSADRTMLIQENQVLDGAKLFIEDFCHNPISNEHKSYCSSLEKSLNDNEVYFCLSDLQKSIPIEEYNSDPYLEDVVYKSNIPCDGIVVFNKSLRSYSNGKSYLICISSDEASKYVSEDYEQYSDAFNACDIDLP